MTGGVEVPGSAVQSILSHNWFLVFFVYGLAYFLMGFSIAFQARRSSTFRLARHLWLLSGFGLLHGVAEWAYIFYPPRFEAGGWENLTGVVLNSSHAIIVALSFVFLLIFGLSLLTSTFGWRPWIRWLPFIFLAIWLWVFILRHLAGSGMIASRWLGQAEIASRYMFALPGAVLTSVGLYFQRGEIRGLNYPPLEGVLLGASLTFAFYGFAGGLVVPYAPFFPARLINTSLFLMIGLPVQILRTLAGVFMAYFVIRSLDLYEIESRNQLEGLRRRELIWLEKERIRRDLHDGVVQGIYGLSLGLGHALKLLKNNPGACEGVLKELEGRTDAIIAQISCYLQELKPTPDLPGKPVLIIEDLLADFTATTGLTPYFCSRGSQEKDMEAAQLDHFYHMSAEILSNVRRHAGAGKVELNLDLGKTGVRLNIRDDGVGFVPADITPQGMGLDNLRIRAALGNGWVDINSIPGKGTEVVLWLPYESSAGEVKS